MGLCRLCPRRCGVDRQRGETGFCKAGARARVFRWGPHFGEEPPLTGEGGSGCVFFSRCTMRCLYCQNSPWSWQGEGEDVETERLREILRGLAVEDRCSNWNLVSPTPYLPVIREAVRPLLEEGVRLPFVWNTSGYETVETLSEYRDLCDIALVDMRYSSDALASAASAAPGYVAANRAAVKWLHDTLGPLDSDEPGAATRGMIVRILVLPGHAGEAVENLAWLAGEGFTDIHVAVMSQYTPAYRALSVPPFDRPVGRDEYERVASAAADMGFEKGWIQDFASSGCSDLLGERMPPGHAAVGRCNHPQVVV